MLKAATRTLRRHAVAAQRLHAFRSRGLSTDLRNGQNAPDRPNERGAESTGETREQDCTHHCRSRLTCWSHSGRSVGDSMGIEQAHPGGSQYAAPNTRGLTNRCDSRSPRTCNGVGARSKHWRARVKHPHTAAILASSIGRFHRRFEVEGVMRASPHRRLTPRSSGAPTARHQARAGGTRYIFTNPGLASCRRRPLSSNVMQN